ncbi:hypothetical protein ACFC96_10780 [Streptomyces sp. NPDC055955]|uniref:hypothetical protein n=1 Tax=Streptomyces sp. NPDC055955 TaxID=3345665 RepID=UPI0035DC087C
MTEAPGAGAPAPAGSDTCAAFADKVIRHPRGQAEGRREAQGNGRSAAIPDAQLDWRD